MRAAVYAALLLALSAPQIAAAQDAGGGPGGGSQDGGGQGGGGPGGGGPDGGGPDGGGGMKEPRGPRPIARVRFDKLVQSMFAAADTNGDGIVTLAEAGAVLSARRMAAINARFAALDTNRDGSISRAEFTAWQMAMGSAALDDATAGGNGADAVIPEVILPRGGGDDADRLLRAHVLEPLSATVIARANTNYDAGMSLAELTAYEDKRFDTADSDHDGWLVEPELRAFGGDRDGGGPPGPAGQAGPDGHGGPPPGQDRPPR